MNGILFVATKKSHYANLALADAVGAKVFKSPEEMTKFSNKFFKAYAIAKTALSLPRNHAYYFTEANFFYPAIARRLGLLKKDSKIINLYSTPLLYLLKTKKQIGWAERAFLEGLLPEVDANVLLGTLGVELAKQTDEIKDKPSISTNLWMSKEIMQKIESFRSPYNLDSSSIFAVARFDWYYKGIDILIRAFGLAWQHNHNLKLYILGGTTLPKSELALLESECRNNIFSAGYIPEAEYWKMASKFDLYVHMGRGDPFALSVVEAMYSGVPTITSEFTGARDAARQLGAGFVIPLDANILAERISDYMSSSQTDKERLRSKSIEIASKYQAKFLRPAFAFKFEKLVANL